MLREPKRQAAISDQIIRARGADLDVSVPKSRELEGGEASALGFRTESKGGEDRCRLGGGVRSLGGRGGIGKKALKENKRAVGVLL